MSFVLQYIPFSQILPDIFCLFRGCDHSRMRIQRPAFDSFYFRMLFIPDNYDLRPFGTVFSTRRCIFNTNGQVASTNV